MNKSDKNKIDLIRNIARPMHPEPTGEVPCLRKLKGIKAIFLDIYGTLIISGSGDISLAQPVDREKELREVLSHHEIPAAACCTPLSGLFMACVKEDRQARMEQGNTHPEVEIRQIWKTFFERLQLMLPTMELPDKELLELIAVEYECRVNPVWPMPGLHDFLKTITATGRIPGIVSNAQFYTELLFPAFLSETLEELGFEDAYSIWSYKELMGKPTRELYQKLLRQAAAADDLQPENCLYIGNDMRNDIRPAQLCGMKTALFAGDKRSLRWRKDYPECVPIKPDLVITELSQVWECV